VLVAEERDARLGVGMSSSIGDHSSPREDRNEPDPIAELVGLDLLSGVGAARAESRVASAS